MTKRQRKKENYLDYIPIINANYKWELDAKTNLVTIQVYHTGIIKKITQLCLHKPKISYIKLDEYGSFIWQQIDGINTLYHIACILKEKFGEQAEPLYNRLIKYFQILYNHRFIQLKRN